MQAYRLELENLPFFKDLSAEEIDRFLQATGASIKRYEKHSRVLKAYEPHNNIGVIVEGKAQILTEDRFGNELVGHTLERGAMIGAGHAILPHIPSLTSVEVLTDALVLFVPYKALLTTGGKLGRIHGIVMKNLLESFCMKNILMIQKIELLSQKNLRERLIVYLLQLEERQKRVRVAVPGRVQLAKELECNRSALTREVALMKEAGMLTVGDGWMELNKEKTGCADD